MSLRHILMAIFIATIWGFNFIAVKVGLNEMPPYLYGAGRFFIAALPFVFVPKPAVSWTLILAVGITSGVLKFTLMFMGIHYGMGAGLASLVLQSQAFFTLLFCVLVFKSRIRFNQIMGMLLAAAGMMLIGWHMQAQSSVLGFSLIIAAAVSWGIVNILYRKVGQVDMFALTVWSSVVPPIPMLCLSLYCDGYEAVATCLTSMSALGWICLAYTACISSWVATTLWAVLIRAYDPQRVAPFSMLVPVFGMGFASLFLDERLTLLTGVAAVLIFTGLIITQWRSKQISRKVIITDAKTLPLPDLEHHKAA